ncbi:hypothetical protein Bca52824_048960 [Brassica carinata]|uniref:Uncharacterized protein n=1 Tax=Brassica carinata TaxID=52824 RepID=A0A8X7UUU0_BRACI|nr:hypothetical protein Bca52824_048960 [Brassica carinata]
MGHPAKAACELSLDPKNMKQEQAKVLEAASCHSEDGAVDTGPTLVLNGLQDILGQYSMVNLELFNIVEEVKKVSKAFVVLLVNAENAQSWDRVKKSCFTGRLVMEGTNTSPRVSGGINAEGWAIIGSVITVIVLIVIWRVIVYGCKKRWEISPRVVPVAEVEMN